MRKDLAIAYPLASYLVVINTISIRYYIFKVNNNKIEKLKNSKSLGETFTLTL